MSAPGATAVDVLAVGAHPDDVELGCGGALMLAIDADLRVAIVDLTRGEAATRGTPERREREARRAAAAMGIETRVNAGLPDALLGTQPGHRLAVVRLLRDLRPRVVLAPFERDRHPDHAAAGHMLREASFLAGLADMEGGPPHRPDHLFHYMLHEPFAPSFVLDVTEVWERKLRALEAYGSQFGRVEEGATTPIAGPEFLEVVEARARFFGSLIGVDRGEPFFAPGPVPLPGLPGLHPTDRPDSSGRYRAFP